MKVEREEAKRKLRKAWQKIVDKMRELTAKKQKGMIDEKLYRKNMKPLEKKLSKIQQEQTKLGMSLWTIDLSNAAGFKRKGWSKFKI